MMLMSIQHIRTFLFLALVLTIPESLTHRFKNPDVHISINDKSTKILNEFSRNDSKGTD